VPGYPPPGYAYPGYPSYGYPPPGYVYPGYPYQPYPNAYAYAPPAKRSGWHKHDGLYLDMATGLGGFSYTTSNVANKGELSGTGISLEFSVGAALTPHLILFGTLYEINSASTPTFKVNGNGGNTSGDVMLLGIGPGVAYYFGEHNFYASGALAFSQLHFDSFLDGLNRSNGDSDWGLALKVTFGKEWWISENWAMGLGAQLVLGSIKDTQLTASGNEATSSSDPSWGVGAFNVLFSATYN
jgi:hypothetical protein